MFYKFVYFFIVLFRKFISFVYFKSFNIIIQSGIYDFIESFLKNMKNYSCYKSPFSSNIFNLFLAYCRRFLAVADVMPSVFEISEYSSPHENFK